MKNRFLALTIVCQIGLYGCAIPVNTKSEITKGNPLEKAEVEASLKQGTKREVVINEFGQPSWSAFDNRIICYEGELLQGVELNPIPVASAISAIAVASAVVVGAGLGGYSGDFSGLDRIFSLIPEDYSENTYEYRRVLIYFDQRAELERIHTYADIKGDRAHSRLIHLLELSAEVGLPGVRMTEENISAVLGSEPAWNWGHRRTSLTTALISAAETGHTEDVEVLLKAGVDANAASDGGATALILASLRGHDETVEALLKAGADVNTVMTDGTTALILASRNGHTKVVRTLLEAGADVNAAKDSGRAALLMASEIGYRTIVGMLLKAGADPTVISEGS